MPYILWSIFYSILDSPVGLYPLKIISNLITGKAQAQMYYIIVLLELTLITPLLIKALGNKKLSVFILLITPIYLLFATGYRYFTGNELPWMGRDFCAWIIFYYFGILVKQNGWKRKNNFLLCSLYVGALILSVFEGLFANSLGMFTMAISQIKISSMLYSLTVIAVIMNRWLGYNARTLYSLKTNKAKKFDSHKIKKNMVNSLVCIGNVSFGIYFCHTFVLRCVSFIFTCVGIMDTLPLPLIQLMQSSFTLIFSVIGICIFQRIDTERKICPYIGF